MVPALPGRELHAAGGICGGSRWLRHRRAWPEIPVSGPGGAAGSSSAAGPKLCTTAEAGGGKGATDQEVEARAEAERTTALFAFFDRRGAGRLGVEELRFATDYLSLRATEAAALAEPEAARPVDLEAFQRWAASRGGCGWLLAARRRAAKTAGLGPGPLEDELSLLGPLGAASLSQGPDAEQEAGSGLPECQQRALRHIRRSARARHLQALPEVEARARALGFQDRHVWMVLAWVHELAPIIVHVDLDRAAQFLEADTHYRNQFETGTSGGVLNKHTRERWEAELFGGAYDGARPSERVKYGVMNVFNDPRGYVGLKNFGDSYLVLRGVRRRCTLAPEDSGECAGGKRLQPHSTCAAERLAVPEFCAHVLQEYSDEELCEALRAANARDVRCGDTGRVVRRWKYKEVQVHGELRLGRHVARLVANERHWPQRERLERLCARHGWSLCWMDQERSRMEAPRRPAPRAAGRWRALA